MKPTMNSFITYLGAIIFIAIGTARSQGLGPCVPDPPANPMGRCVCFPQEDDLKRPHPDDCALYFHCEQERENPTRYYQTIKSCNYGWGFDIDTFECSATPSCLPSASPPTTTTSGPETSPPSTIPTPPECPPTGEAYIPDISYCTSYVICQDGVAIPGQCPPGWNFDYPSGQCLAHSAECYPGSVTATGSPGTPPTPTEPTTTTPTPPSCPPSGEANIPDPNYCNHYFVCVDGVVIPAQCPSGWTFDWISSNCLPFQGECFPGSSPPT